MKYALILGLVLLLGIAAQQGRKFWGDMFLLIFYGRDHWEPWE